jgi:hypothetical protein
VIFKIDFDKAYDSIRWDFVEKVLTRKGFDSRLRGWIMSTVGAGGSALISMGNTGPTSRHTEGSVKVTLCPRCCVTLQPTHWPLLYSRPGIKVSSPRWYLSVFKPLDLHGRYPQQGRRWGIAMIWNPKVRARTQDTRFIQVRVAGVATLRPVWSSIAPCAWCCPRRDCR